MSSSALNDGRVREGALLRVQLIARLRIASAATAAPRPGRLDPKDADGERLCRHRAAAVATVPST